MVIPKYHRKQLREAGHPHLLWTRIWNWALGERYRFRDGSVAYLMDDDIITIRKGDKILWRRRCSQW